MEEIDLYIYDLMTFRDTFVTNFNLFRRSFITQTQSLIEEIMIFPITFPKAFLQLRYKYKFSIWHFLHLLIHEVLINFRNTFFDIREVIYHRIRGHKRVKAKEMGKLIFEAFEYSKPNLNNGIIYSRRLSVPRKENEDNKLGTFTQYSKIEP